MKRFKGAVLPDDNSLERDSVTRFSTLGFFHESGSPQPQNIRLGSFPVFSKIHGDIRSFRCTTGVNNTGGKSKKSSIKSQNIYE
jgi:hypothetical protein